MSMMHLSRPCYQIANVRYLRTIGNVVVSSPGMKRDKAKANELSSQRNCVKGEILHGFHPVNLALKNSKRKFHKLYVQDTFYEEKSRGGTNGSLLLEIEERANTLNIPVEYRLKKHLNRLTIYRPHQGVLLDVEPLQVPTFDWDKYIRDGSTLCETSQLWVWLDHVKDPMVFGAVLRSAHLLGVDSLFISPKNVAALSPLVSKASSGLMEVANIYQSSLVNLIQGMDDSDWLITGGVTNLDGPSVPIQDFQSNENVLLLLGGDEVIDKSLLELCHQSVHLEHLVCMSSPNIAGTWKGSSLTTSAFAAILFHRLALNKLNALKNLQSDSTS